MLKKIVSGLFIVAALQGCASSGGQFKEYYQVAEGEVCRSPTQKMTAWQGCPEILVTDVEGQYTRLLLATPASEGDWVALRCNINDGVKVCSPNARKTVQPDGE